MSITFVIPTIGRDSLSQTLVSLTSEGVQAGDEVLIVADGPCPSARRISEGWRGILPIRYAETEPTGHWGAEQRSLGMAGATGTHIAFIDDDDVYLPGSLTLLRSALTQAPDVPHIFRYVTFQGTTVPMAPYLWQGNISTQCLIVPNVAHRLGVWGERREGDYDFIWDTLDNWRPIQPVWHKEAIASDLVAAERCGLRLERPLPPRVRAGRTFA